MNHRLFQPPGSLLSPSQKLAKSHNENQPVVTTEDFVLNDLPAKKSQQHLTSTTGHLNSFTH